MKKEINKNTVMEDKYTLCVSYVNKEGHNMCTDVEIICSSIEEERVELVNKILNIKDVKEVTSIDFIGEGGLEDDDDTLEYAFKDNFR